MRPSALFWLIPPKHNIGGVLPWETDQPKGKDLKILTESLQAYRLTWYPLPTINFHSACGYLILVHVCVCMCVQACLQLSFLNVNVPSPGI